MNVAFASYKWGLGKCGHLTFSERRNQKTQKKRKNRPEYVNAETQKTILGEQKDSATFEETSEFNPLSIDSVIGYIKTQNPESSAQDVANIITKLSEPKEDQDHLTPEGDLPWGWRTAHEKEQNDMKPSTKRCGRVVRKPL